MEEVKDKVGYCEYRMITNEENSTENQSLNILGPRVQREACHKNSLGNGML
jgi:hypothetical protein